MTMADKIVILRDGIIEQVGTPLEVYDHPVNLFVAQFIGSPSMNLISGIAAKDYVLTAGGVKLPLPKSHKAKPAQEVIYGIRPEDLAVGNGFPAKISVTEPTGPEIHIYADLGDNEICSIVRERQVFKRDSIVEFAPRLDKVHLFDAKTTMAIR